MNKSEFLTALKRALAVLDETELRDIIDEYEQHIDMKIASGLSEEEAIADFGDFKELTAELLEAYHVRADYAEMNGSEERRGAAAERPAEREGESVPGEAGRSGKPTEPAAAGGENAGAGASIFIRWRNVAAGVWMRLWRGVKGAWRWCRRNMKAAAIWIWRAFLWCWRQLCRPFVWMAGLLGIGVSAAADDRTVPAAEEPPAAEKKKGGRVQKMERRSIWAVIGGGIAAFCKWCADVCVWCIRMAWNAFCIISALSVGFVGVCALFMFGMLLILVIGGYPLGGVVIGALGATVSLFAAAGFVMTLLWRKRRPIPAVVPVLEAAPAESEEGSAGAEPITAQVVRPVAEPVTAQVVRPATEPVTAQVVKSAAVLVMEPGAPEETETNGGEEEKEHA